MRILSWGGAVLILDQVTKAVVAHTMVQGQSISVVGDFFRITYIHNSGAAFGLNLGSSLLHTLVSLVAMMALGWLFWSTPRGQRFTRVALSLVLGGALGNIVDRVRIHEVIDFLDFGVSTLRWPVFNVADTFVTVGVLLLVLSYSQGERAQGGQMDRSPRSPEGQAAQG